MAVDRIAAGKPAEKRSQWPCPLEREDRRQAIVDVARAIAAAEGFAAVTFTAVAEKMGFAPSTVYGYFATRQELLSQISLDDTPEVEIAAAQSDPQPTPEPQSEGEEKLDAGYGDLLKAQAEELDRLAKSIIVPGAKAREGTDASLTKLESRLKVVEQSYAELEKRRQLDVDDMNRRLETSAETTRLLQQRLEDAEVRHRAAVAELRLSLFNLEHPDAGKATYAPPDTEAVFVPAPEPVRADPGERPGPAYLSSARSAAIESAMAGESARASMFRMPHIGRRIKLTAAAGLVVCAVGVGAWRMFPAGLPASNETVAASAIAPGVSPGAKPAAKPADRLTSLALAGNADAALLLGLKNLNGEAGPPDLGKAVAWLSRAAAQGQPIAQNYLGVLYRTGTGVAPDMAAAARWFEAAALQGNRMAMANLGKLYAGGWSDGTHYHLATRWFVRAATLGDSDSAFNLAVLYERGDGVPESMFDAYKWYSIAAIAGDKPAAQRANEIARLIPAEDQQAAYLLAKEFTPVEIDRAANVLPTP